MTIPRFPISEEDQKQHQVRSCLGAMLRLVEDAILVRNTKDDDKMGHFVEQSVRLTSVLKEAQEALR